MIWLLDTNVISELWKPHPNPAVVAWLEENKDDCALSEITFGELHYGVHKLAFGKRRSGLLRYISFLREDYRDVILPFGPVESEAWGNMRPRWSPTGARVSGPLARRVTPP
jgi:predicted nucleic acid-binding protein